MARPRSPSPEPSDSISLIKRLKIAHPNGGTTAVTPDDSTSSFAPNLLDHNNISKLHQSYAESTPFHYAIVEKLFQDELLKSVKDECLSELSFTEKETDIYKVRSFTQRHLLAFDTYL